MAIAAKMLLFSSSLRWGRGPRRCFSQLKQRREIQGQEDIDLFPFFSEENKRMFQKKTRKTTLLVSSSSSLREGVKELLDLQMFSAVVDLQKVPSLSSFSTSASSSRVLSLAGIAAYSHLKKPFKARKLAKSVVQDPLSTTDAPTAASLLLNAYCNSDKLQLAESLLFSWLEAAAASNYTDTQSENINELLLSLDNSRNLDRRVSSKEVDIDCLKHALPDAHAWNSLSSLYERRRAWPQCLAILRYFQASHGYNHMNSSSPLPFQYHCAISALAKAQYFESAVELYGKLQEESKKSNGAFRPHPLTSVPLLKLLSEWNEVTNVSVMMELCEEVVQLVIALNRMSEEEFHELHGGSLQVDNDGNKGFHWVSTGFSRYSRVDCIRHMLGTLFTSLGPHRGLNQFSTGLADHLTAHGVEIPTDALIPMIEGRARANNWRDALPLYKQLEKAIREGGADDEAGRVRGRDTIAYHWITEAMLRDGATDDLAQFIVSENK